MYIDTGVCGKKIFNFFFFIERFKILPVNPVHNRVVQLVNEEIGEPMEFQ